MSTIETPEPTANLAILNECTTDLEHFTLHLAEWCHQWIMEIAKPIMEHAQELYADKSLVILIDRWFDAEKQYHHRRKSYLVQWAKSKAEGSDFEPLDSYRWADGERQAYNEALRVLLIR